MGLHTFCMEPPIHAWCAQYSYEQTVHADPSCTCKSVQCVVASASISAIHSAHGSLVQDMIKAYTAKAL